MLWYLRCIGLCAPHLAQLALQRVQFDEHLPRRENKFLNSDVLQNNHTQNNNINGKDKN